MPKIKIEKLTGEDKFKASLSGGKWEVGHSISEAIGNAVRSWPDALGIEIEITDSAQSLIAKNFDKAINVLAK